MNKKTQSLYIGFKYILCIYMIRREFDSKVRKVGNSYVVTIPANIVKRFKLKQGKFVTANIIIEDGKKK